MRSGGEATSVFKVSWAPCDQHIDHEPSRTRSTFVLKARSSHRAGPMFLSHSLEQRRTETVRVLAVETTALHRPAASGDAAYRIEGMCQMLGSSDG